MVVRTSSKLQKIPAAVLIRDSFSELPDGHRDPGADVRGADKFPESDTSDLLSSLLDIHEIPDLGAVCQIGPLVCPELAVNVGEKSALIFPLPVEVEETAPRECHPFILQPSRKGHERCCFCSGIRG